ncbi:hypothetical protein ACO1MB_14310, partial [Staphylococcus aureus]
NGAIVLAPDDAVVGKRTRIERRRPRDLAVANATRPTGGSTGRYGAFSASASSEENQEQKE